MNFVGGTVSHSAPGAPNSGYVEDCSAYILRGEVFLPPVYFTPVKSEN